MKSTRWIDSLIAIDDKDFSKQAFYLAEVESSLSLTKNLSAPLIQTQTESRLKIMTTIQRAILLTAKTLKYAENMSLELATILTLGVYESFQTYPVEDVLLMLKMGRKEQLTPSKGRLDSEILAQWTKMFFEKKEDERERLWNLEKENYNKTAEKLGKNFSELPEESQKKLNKLFSKIGKPKEEDTELKPVINHHHIWLTKLKDSVKTLTDTELLQELDKAKKSDSPTFGKATEIYQKEKDLRKI